MKKDIKDYLHLYLGRLYQWLDGDMEWRRPEVLTAYQLNSIRQSGREVRLLLRPLSDMTEEEARELFIAKDKHVAIKFEWTSIILTKNPASQFEKAMKFEPGWRIQATYKYPDDPNGKEQSMIGTLSLGVFSPSQFTLALSKGFDLFGLIESGLAINRTTSTLTNEL